jgi:hypothetical protein
MMALILNISVRGEGVFHEKSEDQNFRFFPFTAGVVPSLLHPHRALRYENRSSRKKLSSRLLLEGASGKRQSAPQLDPIRSID